MTKGNPLSKINFESVDIPAHEDVIKLPDDFEIDLSKDVINRVKNNMKEDKGGNND